MCAKRTLKHGNYGDNCRYLAHYKSEHCKHVFGAKLLTTIALKSRSYMAGN